MFPTLWMIKMVLFKYEIAMHRSALVNEPAVRVPSLIEWSDVKTASLSLFVCNFAKLFFLSFDLLSEWKY